MQETSEPIAVDTPVRWGLASTDPALADIEARLARRPEITVPTLVIHGGSDPCNEQCTLI
jgi:alpha-beta hydrolase superfamily lysophospholipase